jgi:hypothetical protein
LTMRAGARAAVALNATTGTSCLFNTRAIGHAAAGIFCGSSASFFGAWRVGSSFSVPCSTQVQGDAAHRNSAGFSVGCTTSTDFDSDYSLSPPSVTDPTATMTAVKTVQQEIVVTE